MNSAVKWTWYSGAQTYVSIMQTVFCECFDEQEQKNNTYIWKERKKKNGLQAAENRDYGSEFTIIASN